MAVNTKGTNELAPGAAAAPMTDWMSRELFGTPVFGVEFIEGALVCGDASVDYRPWQSQVPARFEGAVRVALTKAAYLIHGQWAAFRGGTAHLAATQLSQIVHEQRALFEAAGREPPSAEPEPIHYPLVDEMMVEDAQNRAIVRAVRSVIRPSTDEHGDPEVSYCPDALVVALRPVVADMLAQQRRLVIERTPVDTSVCSDAERDWFAWLTPGEPVEVWSYNELVKAVVEERTSDTEVWVRGDGRSGRWRVSLGQVRPRDFATHGQWKFVGRVG